MFSRLNLALVAGINEPLYIAVDSWPPEAIAYSSLSSVTNFIRPYLHQFFIDSHGLNGYGEPLKRPFHVYQSCLEAINDG